MLTAEARPALKVALTGIDGAGKSSVISDVVTDLAKNNRIVHAASRPVFSVVDGERQPHYKHLLGMLDKLHSIADQTHNPNCVCAVNAAIVTLQGRVIEPSMIRRIQPTLVLGGRDLLVDPAVYALFYSPRLASKSMPERIDFLQSLTGTPIRDVIFFLTVPPEEAVRRIDKRIKKERKGLNTPDRTKWRHMHENPVTLGIFQVRQRRIHQLEKLKFKKIKVELWLYGESDPALRLERAPS